ncbi:hypothetical protein D3C78_1817640 [compost metagenome]
MQLMVDIPWHARNDFGRLPKAALKVINRSWLHMQLGYFKDHSIPPNQLERSIICYVVLIIPPLYDLR